MGAWVTHDAPFADPLAPDLELGFDQQHRFRPHGLQQASQRRQHPRQRDERHIGHGQIRPAIVRPVEIGRQQVTQIGALTQHHARVGAEAPGGLAVAHIDAVDALGPVLQQAVAEATGGDAAIEADPPLHPDRQGLQCCQQLLAAAGDEARRRLHLQIQIG